MARETSPTTLLRIDKALRTHPTLKWLFRSTLKESLHNNFGCVKVAADFTGITKMESKELFTYPNPTKGEVNVVLPSNLKGKVSLTIYNTQGVSVMEKIFSFNATRKTCSYKNCLIQFIFTF